MSGRVSAVVTPLASHNGTPQPPTYAERMSIAHLDKPWKNPNFVRKSGTARNKTLKQVLLMERERTLPVEERIKRKKKKAAGKGIKAVDAEATALAEEEAEAAEATGPLVTYYSIEAHPSTKPAKRYCDITGLEAPYTDPKSNLRYHNAEIYALVRTFAPSTDQAYLSVRGSGLMIK